MKKELLADLYIDFASPVPVYEQLKKIIKVAIAKNILVMEEHLPSIRELASFLKINPNTVARAYRELSFEKVIGGRAGKGFWVAENRNPEDRRMELLKESFREFLEKAVAMGFTPEQIKIVMNDLLTPGTSTNEQEVQ